MSRTIRVTNSTDLADVMLNATGGETLLLETGTYDLRLYETSKFSFDYDAPVTITSADPDAPATFSNIYVRGANNLTFDNVVFDYTYDASHHLNAKPFNFWEVENLTIRNSHFDGDLAQNRDADSDGLGFAVGLNITRGENVVIENNTFEDFYRGLTFGYATNAQITGNEMSGLRMDGMNFVGAQGVTITDNHIHDFNRSEAAGDHADMIQFWTKGAKRATTDVVIANNRLDIGDGDPTQAIFMRNEEVDQGRAGSELYYQNIEIRDNLIINAHTHGITLGESDGVEIRNNTLVLPPDSDDDLPTPRIRVAETSENVTIAQNITTALSVPDHTNWVIEDNLIVQQDDGSADNHYDAVFLTSSLDEHDFFVQAEGLAGQRGAGAQDISEITGVQFVAHEDPSAPGLVHLTADPNGAQPEGTTYTWTMPDGTVLAGQTLSHQLGVGQDQEIILTAERPDGTRLSADAEIDIADVVLVQMAANGDLVAGQAPGVNAAQAATGLTLDGSGVVAEIATEHLRAMLNSPAFEISFGLQTNTLGNTGELFRLHSSFSAAVTRDGAFQIRLSPTDGADVVLTSTGINVSNGAHHEIEVSYHNGQIDLLVDGVVVDTAEMTGGLQDRNRSSMVFGNPLGRDNFDGIIDGFEILRAPADAAPSMGPVVPVVPTPAPVTPTPVTPPAPVTPSPSVPEENPAPDVPEEPAPEPSEEPTHQDDAEEPPAPEVPEEDTPEQENEAPREEESPFEEWNGLPQTAGAELGNGAVLSLQDDGSFLAHNGNTQQSITAFGRVDDDGISLGSRGMATFVSGQHAKAMTGTDSFELALTLEADDRGAQPAVGDVLRLPGSLTVQILSDGHLSVRAIGEDVSVTRLLTEDLNLTDGNSHDIIIRLEDGQLEAWVDGTLAASAEMESPLASAQGQDLLFGNPWGGKNFKGTITKFELRDAPSSEGGQPPQAPLTLTESAAALAFADQHSQTEFDLEDPAEADVFEFVAFEDVAEEAAVSSSYGDGLFDGA